MGQCDLGPALNASRLRNVSKIQKLALFKARVLPEAKAQSRTVITENCVLGVYMRLQLLPRLLCNQISQLPGLESRRERTLVDCFLRTEFDQTNGLTSLCRPWFAQIINSRMDQSFQSDPAFLGLARDSLHILASGYALLTRLQSVEEKFRNRSLVYPI